VRAKRAQSLKEHTLDFAVKINHERITVSIAKEIKRFLIENFSTQFYEKIWQNEY
jgi:hypothetical protein